MHSPVSYSFYKIDNELYYVPSKNVKTKNYSIPVFHFENTKSNETMFSKIESDINIMIAENEVVKMDII